MASVASHADPTPTASVVDAHVAAGANDPIKPLLVKTITFRTAPVQMASLAPMPALVAIAASAPLPVPQPQPSIPAPAQAIDQPHTLMAAADPAPAPMPAPAPAKADVIAAAPNPALAPVTVAPTPAAAPVTVAPAPAAAPTAPPAALLPAAKTPAAEPDQAAAATPDTADDEPAKAEPVIASVAPVHAHGGWLIQIGAFDDEDQAKQHLSAAQTKVSAALKTADPFTERIQKGDKAFYRARFAGFDRSTAEAACKQLKRSDFECMALKD
jgi:D-alanyl-D-alanine carboxypeptidase